MAVLTETEIIALIKDELQINVTTDVPVSATELRRAINDVYAEVKELSGGAVKHVASATAWTTAQSATGIVTGVLTDIDEILHVFASTTSGSTGFSSGDVEVTRKELSYIQALRSANGLPSYSLPKFCSVTRLATTTPASVGLHRLDYFPSVTGFYFPIHYVPQFTPLDDTITTPDVNDLESRDIALMTAMRLAPGLHRAELVPGIALRISERTAAALERKASALMAGKQDQ